MLAKKLKALRTKSGKTQQQLADMLGITRQGYAKYENNLGEPDNATLTKLADYFDVTTDYLLGRDINKLLNNNEDEEEFLKWMNDPTTDLFFKEYIESPDEMKEQLRKIWDIIKTQQK
jgi:transcriptional regulator with XRE-family HTH domain